MENHYNCIYLYINKHNNKKYIGQAMDFNRRYKQHLNDSYNEKKKDYDVPFHRAIRKYGIENFEIKILAENIQTREKLNEYEIFFIKRYKTLAIQNGYNVANGGSVGNTFAGKTEKEMNEIRKKMSEATSGENNHNYGKHLPEETRNKISNSLKGEKHWNYGKKTSEETRNKISKNHANVKGLNSPTLGMLIERRTKEGKLMDIKYQFEYAEMGFDAAHISSCCKGKRKSHKGFIFKYYKNTTE